ncbi:hypothetical protein CDD81_6669 [Ophiocordyceps australis]|uniref:Uncharacterized protein n=1 Tax=Ophiocordyceps australis TaxID=1399860 RepID=A0A2C5Y265_9HYPO|nr:hypothetical protein CDD81_6669 [Ophiocordyceps australis]
MCTYDLNVVLCGCRDPACKQRDAELDQWLTEPGHVLEVCWYYRISGLCLGSFYNHDPNRLVVRLGMDPRNGNSTQDCTNKKIDFDEPYWGKSSTAQFGGQSVASYKSVEILCRQEA